MVYGEQWEYKVVAINVEDEIQLNRLGSEGWELVAVIVKFSIWAYFKRKKG